MGGQKHCSTSRPTAAKLKSRLALVGPVTQIEDRETSQRYFSTPGGGYQFPAEYSSFRTVTRGIARRRIGRNWGRGDSAVTRDVCGLSGQPFVGDFRWSMPKALSETRPEVGRAAKSDLISDFGNRAGPLLEQLVSALQAHVSDKLDG